MKIFGETLVLFVCCVGNLPPMNVLDKNDVKTVMHFAKVCANVGS